MVKNPPANAGDIGDEGSIPGPGRFPGGDGNPFQYPCLENSMHRGVWLATVHGEGKSWTGLKRLSMHAHKMYLDRLHKNNIGDANSVA